MNPTKGIVSKEWVNEEFKDNFDPLWWDVISPRRKPFGLGKINLGTITVEAEVTEERENAVSYGYNEFAIGRIMVEIAKVTTGRDENYRSVKSIKNFARRLGEYYTLMRKYGKGETVRYKVDEIKPIYIRMAVNTRNEKGLFATESGLCYPIIWKSDRKVFVDIFPVAVMLKRGDTDRREKIYGTMIMTTEFVGDKKPKILKIEFIPQYLPVVELAMARRGINVGRNIRTVALAGDTLLGVGHNYVTAMSLLEATIKGTVNAPQIFPNFPIPTNSSIEITVPIVDNEGIRFERLTIPDINATARTLELGLFKPSNDGVGMFVIPKEVGKSRRIYFTGLLFVLSGQPIPIVVGKLTPALIDVIRTIHGRISVKPEMKKVRRVNAGLPANNVKKVATDVGEAEFVVSQTSFDVRGISAVPGALVVGKVGDQTVVGAKIFEVRKDRVGVSAGLVSEDAVRVVSKTFNTSRP